MALHRYVHRPLHQFLRWSVIGVIGLLILAAVSLSAGRWLLLNLMDYKSDLERLISDVPAYQVRVGELQGRWIGFSPRIEATSVKVTLEGGRQVSMGRMELQLDTLRSLWRAEVVFGQVLLDQLDLSLYRGRESGWGLAGPPTSASDNPSPANATSSLLPLLQTLLAQQELEIRNARVQVQFEDHEPLAPQLINVKLQNQGGNHSLKGQLVPGLEKPIVLQAVLHGLPGEAGFSSEFYFSAPDLDQHFWGQFVSDLPRLPQQFMLGAEFWGRWRPDGKHRLQGRISVPQLEWQEDQQQLSLAEAGFQFNAAWDGLQQGELALTELHGTIDGVALPLQRLSLRKQGAEWSFSSDTLTLEPLWQIINRSSLVADALKQRLAGLDPVGRLDNARLVLHSGDETQAKPVSFDFSADLHRVGVSPWHGAPGIEGVSGLLQLNAEGGRVDFTSEKFSLNFPKLYSQGWQFDRARGVVRWEMGAQGVRVISQHLQIEDEKLRADGRFSLDLPAVSAPGSLEQEPLHKQQGRLVLMIGMERADASLVPLFVPDKIVSQPLHHWLKTSVISGQVARGGVLVDTPLHMSDDVSSATVQLFFQADQAEVRYQPEWPAVTQSNPFILIKGSELLVDIPRGQLLGTALSQARVYLPAHSSVLQIDADLDGPAADIRTVLVESPLREVLGEALKPWQLDGVSHSQLALGIDLQHPQQSRIRIESTLSDGLLSNTQLGLDFSQLAGTLRYHEREGLSSERISGSLLGQPLQADIITEPFFQGTRTSIRGSGWVAIDPLNQWLQQPLLQHLEGETQYQARLDICPSTPGCSNLRIESQLRGVTAQFPVPFAKTAEQLQPLSIDISLAENPSLRMRYAQQLDFAMPISSPFSGAELVFGSDQPPAVSRGDGLWIRGHLDEVGVAPWQTFISQTFLHPDPSVTRSTKDSPDPAELLKQVQLDIDRLNYGAFQVESLQLALTPDEEHWGLTLESPVIRGRVLLPMAEGLVQVELEHLHIPKPETATISEPVATVPFDRSQDLLLDFDPSTLPGAQVSINALSHGDRRLGRWRFELQPYRKGVLVKGIDAQVGSLGVIAELDWGYQNKHHSSYIDLSLSAVDLGAVMQEWGATPNISTESAELKGQFIWQGSPLAFNRDTLDGETRLQLNNGRIRNSGGGTQVVKIFSLFNTSTLWRRLSLDFSDLAQDEISFESISGHYRISDAVATSIVPLTVVGPTIGLEFEGTVDLYNETLSQRMLVSLPISENLPIAAVFLATPQIAGAMFLVEKLIGKQLSKFTSVRYSIDGLWSEPKMELIKAAAPSQQMDIQN